MFFYGDMLVYQRRTNGKTIRLYTLVDAEAAAFFEASTNLQVQGQRF